MFRNPITSYRLGCSLLLSLAFTCIATFATSAHAQRDPSPSLTDSHIDSITARPAHAPSQLRGGPDCVPGWIPMFGGFTGVDNGVSSFTVQRMVTFDDGGGDALYLAGQFISAVGKAITGIAKWNGSSASPLGTGVNNFVHALAVFDDGGGPALYAGGEFTTAGGVTANRIAKWNGSTWTTLGTGMNNIVRVLFVFDDGGGPALYAGGDFTTAGGVTVNRIAKWNGSTWSALGTGMNDSVRSMGVFDDGGGPRLYVGGFFTTSGGVTTNRIARWNGSTWSALGTGMNGFVYALTVFDDGGGPRLYAGGDFTTSGGVTTNRLARWNGSSWSAIGTGMTGTVFGLTLFDDGGGNALYATGTFTSANGVSAMRVAKWNGSSWSALGTGLNEPWGICLAVFDDGLGGGPALHVGGAFFNAGSQLSRGIARWNPDTAAWSPLRQESGLNNWVQTAISHDDGSGSGPALFVGGSFTSISGASIDRIAKWDGSSWSALGTGMENTVLTLASFDDGGGPALYAGGFFTTAGGVTVNRIAKWNGSSWSALGTGMNNSVHALGVFDDGGGPALYAGGTFTTAGGISANRIAKWNGSSWSALGTGLGSTCAALAVFNDGGGNALYAGGSFTTAGGISANRIAKWNGSTWSALGVGTNNDVRSLAATQDGIGGGSASLFVGGTFTTAGGITVNRIARWNGSSWSALATGLGANADALCIYDDGSNGGGNGPALYVGGNFTTAGGLSAILLARWSGSAWSAVSQNSGTFLSGFNVRGMTVHDDGSGIGPSLIVGGSFSGSPSCDSYLAMYGGCNATFLDVDYFDIHTFEAFGEPNTVTAADFGQVGGGPPAGDGFFDAAVAIPTDPPGGTGAMQVFLNNGNTGSMWDGLTPIAPVSVGIDPSGIASGDLDQADGMDVAVCNAGSDDVYVFLNDGNGSGTFISPIIISDVGDHPSDIAILDVNNDGLLDIAVSNLLDDNVVVYLNQGPQRSGGGGRSIAFDLEQNLPVGSQPTAIHPEDLDGDKDLDLAVAIRGEDRVIIFNNQNAGNLAQQTILLLAMGAGPVDIASGDLDNNGFPDLVVANNTNSTLSIFLNLGSYNFLPRIDITVGDLPRAVDVGDFNDDGQLDIAVVAVGNNDQTVVQLLFNLGSTPGDLNLDIPVNQPIGAEPNYLVTTQLNNYGGDDLITVNQDSAFASGGSVTGLIIDPPPPPPGACCLPDASCLDDVSDAHCHTAGGIFQGEDSTCDSVTCSLPCPADIAPPGGDGHVTISDINFVIAAYGLPCDNCPQDIVPPGGDGQVTISDINAILSAFGPCP